MLRLMRKSIKSQSKNDQLKISKLVIFIRNYPLMHGTKCDKIAVSLKGLKEMNIAIIAVIFSGTVFLFETIRIIQWLIAKKGNNGDDEATESNKP